MGGPTLQPMPNKHSKTKTMSFGQKSWSNAHNFIAFVPPMGHGTPPPTPCTPVPVFMYATHPKADLVAFFFSCSLVDGSLPILEWVGTSNYTLLCPPDLHFRDIGGGERGRCEWLKTWFSKLASSFPPPKLPMEPHLGTGSL